MNRGLLVVAQLGATLDARLVRVGEDGAVIMSSLLGALERRILGLDRPVRVEGLAAGHGVYLA